MSSASLRQKLLKPLDAAGRIAARSVARTSGPLAAHIAAAEQSGEDLTVAVRREYVSAQLQLLEYRKQRFWHEWEHVCEGHYGLANLKLLDLLYFARFWVKVAFVFLAANLLGRFSIFPLLEPRSPLVQALEHVNPNDIEPHYFARPPGRSA